jgi:predicted RNA methylase
MSRYGELSIHRWMLRDQRRNEAYQRALQHVVRPGDVVLDVGAGTGILSIFAASSGARKVYAVERTEVTDVARRMVEHNGHAERIEIIQCDIEDLAVPDDLTDRRVGVRGYFHKVQA